MLRYTAQIIPTLPTLAIDLGYSTRSRSCGVASSSSELPQVMEFGECIDYSEDLILDQGPHLILLEAVLSTYHLPNGNPCIRGDFEKGRGWYHGPGVTTFAAALRFLSELHQRLPSSIERLPIIEGFLSYKTSKTDHSDDAMKMLVDFEKAERFTPHPNSEPICPLIDSTPEIRRYNPPPGEKQK